MASLANDYARATDATFREQVRAAIYKVAPAVIGEAVANPPSATAVNKRHAWMLNATQQPDVWVPIVAFWLAGTPTIRSTDMPAAIADATVDAALTSIISDLAGVLASEA